MPPTRPLRLEPEWDARFSRMVGVSAVAHVAVVVAVVLFALAAHDSHPPLVAYTVELTDPSALGGRLPPGPPGPVFSGGPQEPPAPEPRGVAAAPEPAPAAEKAAVEPPPAKAPEPPAVEKPPAPEVKLPEAVAKPPEPKPEVKEPEVKLEPKPEPKVEPEPKPEEVAVKPEPAKPAAPKPEPPKVATPKKEPAPVAKAEPPKAAAPRADAKAAPVADAKAEAKPPPAPPGKAGSPTGSEEAPPRDAYTAAAERWRARASGLGGTDTAPGALGTGGGPGGGGQLVGVEFLAYRQQVINTIRAQWTNVIATAGLVASVRFEIGPDGAVSSVRLEQSSGNTAYDASALRAVQRTTQLPPPPARYAKEFREFVMEFHSEDKGGQEAG